MRLACKHLVVDSSMNPRPADASSVADSPPVDGARPSEAVRTELREILARDDSRVGEVYRGLQRGLSPDEIANE